MIPLSSLVCLDTLASTSIVSEILSSMVLFTLIATDIFLEAANVPGHGPFLYQDTTSTNITNTTDTISTSTSATDELHDRRMNALLVYAVIMSCQILGIFVS